MLPLSDRGFAICSREELRRSQSAGAGNPDAPGQWAEHRLDRAQALNLVRRSQSDIWAQASLRSMVANGLPPTAMSRLDDDQLAEVVADMITSGKMVLVRSQLQGYIVEGERLPSAPPQSSVAAPPSAAAASQPSDAPPSQDPPVFPSNISAAAQAAAMQQAAQQGQPFCPQ